MTDYNWPEITNDTPLSEIKEIHRRIWDYVIENGAKPRTPYKHNCALCSYKIACDDSCDGCIAKWSSGACYKNGSEYKNWQKEYDPEKKRLFAMKIRDIEFKEEKREKAETEIFEVHIVTKKNKEFIYYTKELIHSRIDGIFDTDYICLIWPGSDGRMRKTIFSMDCIMSLTIIGMDENPKS